MSKEMLMVVEAIANEKDVDKGVIFEAIELALAAATKKQFEDEEADIRVEIDRKTGEHRAFRRWLVVDNDAVPALGTELTLEEAHEIDPNLKPGDIYEIPVESADFGRIGAQAAKQIIVQKVREAERAKIVEAYRHRVGELVSGTVKKNTRDNIIVDLGNNAEAILPKDQTIGQEKYRLGDRVRALLKEIREDQRGAQLVLSRTCNEMIESRGPIPPPLRPAHDGWVFGCDICQEVCPWNRRRLRRIPPDRAGLRARLAPRSPWPDPPLGWLLELDEQRWREATRRTALRRPRWRGLLRNALVAAGNAGDPVLAPAVAKHLASPDPLIREHASWAWERLEARRVAAAPQAVRGRPVDPR